MKVYCLIRSGMVFMSAHRAIRHSVDTESVTEPSCFLSRYVVGVPFVYFDYMLESCWLKTWNFVGSKLVKICSKQFSPCLFDFLCCVLKRGLITYTG